MDLNAPISTTNIFGFMIVFMIITTVFFIYHARKTKKNMYYTGSGLCGSMAFAFLVGALGQYLLSLILLAVSALFGIIVVYPRAMRAMPEEVAKAKNTVDTSESIRFKDFFSVNAMVKLEKKYGEYKAMVIWSAVGTVFFVPVLFVMVLLRVISLPFGVGAVVFAFISGLTMYRRMRKGL